MIVSDRVRAAQIRSIYRNTPPGMLGTAAAVMCFTAVLAYIGAVETRKAVVLALIASAQAGGRLLLYRAYRRSADADLRWRYWAQWFTTSTAVGGFMIGSGIVWIMSTGRIEVQSISLLLVFAFTSGALSAYAAYMPAFMSFLSQSRSGRSSGC